MIDNIIIVDDSKTARMVIKRCLEIAGFHGATFLEAANGKEALNIAKGHDVGLIVTDLNMPEMDGTSLLKHVKASPRLHELPVIVITSLGNPAKVEELKALGALAILNKPVSPANLADVLGNIKNEDEWGY
jgi:two-component system chemotaxis response regulator CheY